MIQNAGKQFNNLTGQLETTRGQSQTQIEAAKKAAQDAQASARGQLQGAVGNLTTQAQQQYNQANTVRNQALQQQEQLRQALSGLYNPGTTLAGRANPNYGVPEDVLNYSVNQQALSPEQYQSLGMDQGQYNNLISALTAAGTSDYMTGHNFGAPSQTYQFNPLDVLSQQQIPELQQGMATTPEQYAQFNALNQLAGGTLEQSPEFSMENMAGTAPANYNNTNQFDYNTLINAANDFDVAGKREAKALADQLTMNADAQHAASKQHGWSGLVNKVSNAVKPVAKLAPYLNPLTLPGALANNTKPDVEGFLNSPVTNPALALGKETLDEVQKRK